MTKRVWYAGYGSNLSHERFLSYVGGGLAPGASERSIGCRDKTPPAESRPISLRFELYFAGYSTTWRGARAFIRPGSSSLTYGRMYLITDDQFNDVVRQENSMGVSGERFIPPFGELQALDSLELPGPHAYRLLVKVGSAEGWPILTFTTPATDPAIGAPSERYVKVIAAGLKETYPALRTEDISRYLLRAEGIRDRISAGELFRWVREAPG
jgi:hypothetical protein